MKFKIGDKVRSIYGDLPVQKTYHPKDVLYYNKIGEIIKTTTSNVFLVEFGDGYTINFSNHHIIKVKTMPEYLKDV